VGGLIQAPQQWHVQQSVDDPQLCSFSAGEPVTTQRRTSRPRTDARSRDARRLHRPLDQPHLLGQLQRALFSFYIQRKWKLRYGTTSWLLVNIHLSYNNMLIINIYII